jgi:hypothetical protein
MGCFFSFILKKSCALIVKWVVEEVKRGEASMYTSCRAGGDKYGRPAEERGPREMWSGRATMNNYNRIFVI